jgi:hypothetical protein
MRGASFESRLKGRVGERGDEGSTKGEGERFVRRRAPWFS